MYCLWFLRLLLVTVLTSCVSCFDQCLSAGSLLSYLLSRDDGSCESIFTFTDDGPNKQKLSVITK